MTNDNGLPNIVTVEIARTGSFEIFFDMFADEFEELFQAFADGYAPILTMKGIDGTSLAVRASTIEYLGSHYPATYIEDDDNEDGGIVYE